MATVSKQWKRLREDQSLQLASTGRAASKDSVYREHPHAVKLDHNWKVCQGLNGFTRNSKCNPVCQFSTAVRKPGEINPFNPIPTAITVCSYTHDHTIFALKHTGKDLRNMLMTMQRYGLHEKRRAHCPSTVEAKWKKQQQERFHFGQWFFSILTTPCTSMRYYISADYEASTFSI